MRRRELLKATGLAAVADLEAVAERGESEGSGDSSTTLDGQSGTVLARLPDPEDVDGRYEVTVARRLDADVLQDPDLFAGADAHAVLASPGATLTVGVGVPGAALDALDRQGLERAGSVEGRPLFVRRGRYEQRVAAVDDGTVVVGRGGKLEPVASLVRTVATPRARPLERRLPAVAAVRDRLGPGAVLSLFPAGRPVEDAPRPAATGARLAVRPPGGRLRTVDVYESPRAGRAGAQAAASSDASPAGDFRVARDGRAVVADRSVPATDLPLSGE